MPGSQALSHELVPGIELAGGVEADERVSCEQVRLCNQRQCDERGQRDEIRWPSSGCMRFHDAMLFIELHPPR